MIFHRRYQVVTGHMSNEIMGQVFRNFIRISGGQDMLNLASKYGLKYTGVMIENYEDKTDGEITKQTDQ